MSNISFQKLIGKGYNKLFNIKTRYILLKGARNTKKSYVGIVYHCLISIFSDTRNNALILRQVAKSHRTTTFKTFLRIINTPDPTNPQISFRDLFKVNHTDMTITRIATGQVIMFEGMDDVEKLQGIQVQFGYLTRVYIDEAFQLKSYEDWNKVDGSIRGDLPQGLYHQIVFCFNAWNEKHWIYDHFFRNRLEDDYDLLENCDKGYVDYYAPDEFIDFGKGIYLHTSTYRINEFRDKEIYDKAMQTLKDNNIDLYKVNALGMWGNAAGSTYQINESCIKDKIDDNFSFITIGIDTGLSNSRGKIIYNSTMRYKSATTMVLKGLTHDYQRLIALDEMFITNQGRAIPLTQPEIITIFANKIKDWQTQYARYNIGCYVDCADIGFKDSLQLKLKEIGVYSVYCMGSTKKPIEERVSFTNMMFAYGDYIISTNCKNLLREMRNSQKGEDGEPREDFDDHTINANEYADAPLYNYINTYKEFVKHD